MRFYALVSNLGEGSFVPQLRYALKGLPSLGHDQAGRDAAEANLSLPSLRQAADRVKSNGHLKLDSLRTSHICCTRLSAISLE